MDPKLGAVVLAVIALILVVVAGISRQIGQHEADALRKRKELERRLEEDR